MIENIKILHFVPDDKFTDTAYLNFESVAPSCNTFFVPSMTKNLKYIEKTPVEFINPISFKNPFFMKSLNKYDIIVLHSLSVFNQEIVAHANPCLKFVWIGMGYDYYDLIYENPECLYQKRTRDIVKNLHIKKKSNDGILKQIANNILHKQLEKKSIVEKINFFAPVLENEYEMVASKFAFNFPNYVDWNYGSTVRMIEGKIKHCKLNNNDILVGNSATPTNNHLEVFDFLRTQNLKGKKIICPLSYGNSEYAHIIKNAASIYFGNRFLAVDKFIPYDNYISIISSCSNVIMNHHRQQGGGNITAMLYMGAKVFLNTLNPFYTFYKGKGAVVFSLDELYNNPKLLDLHLSEEDIEKNRQIIKLAFNEKAILDKTEKLIKKVISSELSD
ncbi:TDP-N-acetylfucosamine:lipid II N-acetylfucosaminyltransferase [Methanococcoides alaskense]|uniref:4-alpha-L-fucosyltransferase n=1 Tax=Methanococcoides alaskense TaxID=325778 RepID=A0AA90U0C0_9EURY|nr:TDP-N-acetylfucosamine:lipid II N-acetylfucosaminyltransferase [Methanococcoides alaskense]MDA0524842.1 TDP-N-acetylfucosamine:lipid II N-acetylfucosaminyltransferase [Methanococcoides alaskense]MDR6223034.1 hypothetical protein [Methanococcoides alaskense]